jgi:hypothetical protein
MPYRWRYDPRIMPCSDADRNAAKHDLTLPITALS